MIHQERTHPDFVPGCWQCQITTVSPAASAMPSRSPHAAETAAREKRWQRDMPAYRELRRQHVQPRGIDGSADLAMRAEDKLEVESGQLLSRRQLAQTKSILADA